MRLSLSTVLLFLYFLTLSHTPSVACEPPDNEFNSSASLKTLDVKEPEIIEKDTAPFVPTSASTDKSRQKSPVDELFNWDAGETKEILRKIDKDFFQEEAKGEKVAGGIGGLFSGLLTSSPTSAVFLFTTGDALRIPPSGSAGSWAMVGWTVITTAPAFGSQMARRFKIIHRSLHQKDAYLVSLYDREATERAEDKLKKKRLGTGNIPEEESLISDKESALEESTAKIYKSKPLLIEASSSYKAGKVFFLLGSAANASVPCVQMLLIEKKRLLMASILAVPFFAAITEHLYKISVDRLKNYVYTDAAIAHTKRNTLLRKIDEFQKLLATNNTFVTKQYKIVTGKTTLEAARLPSKLSTFFIRDDEVRLDPEQPEGRALNFIVDSDVPFPSACPRALPTWTDLAMGAGTISRYITTHYMLTSLFFWAGVEPNTAFWLSHSFAALVTGCRCFAEYDVHHKNSQALLNTFSYTHLGSNKKLRKASDPFSLVNGALFGLIYPVI
jgi:hypothetical protein